MTNKNPKHTQTKLDLRRWALDKYDVGPLHVLDCFQGGGQIWKTLKTEFPVKSYWGVDKKEQRGRMAIDPVKLLLEPNIKSNVIDINANGSPWACWQNLLPNIRQPTIVFLTTRTTAAAPIDSAAAHQIGLDRFTVPPPTVLIKTLAPFALNWLLSVALKFCTRLEVFEAETTNTNKSRFFACYLDPITKGTPTQ